MERYAWHYLYNSAAGRTLLERSDESHVCVALPNMLDEKISGKYRFMIDERDQRTFVVFDGYLLAGSPKRKGCCIFHVPIGEIRIPKGQFFVPKGDELGIPPYRYILEGKFVELQIYRFFLLLRGGTFVFAGYDPKNLSPRYLISIVHAQRTTEEGRIYEEYVEWRVGG